MRRELILTFHGLGTPPRSISDAERRVWVPFEWFEAIVDACPSHGVTITFDDGNASDVELALPLLAERGMSARFFPLSGRIGAPGYLDERDISCLRDAGMSIGSQGVNHRDWRRLGDAELNDELALSRRAFAAIVGAEVTEAACPYGSYDRRVLGALRRAGYRRVFNSDGGTGASGARVAPRTTVDRGRPLSSWIALTRGGAGARPGPILLGKRLVKRLR